MKAPARDTAALSESKGLCCGKSKAETKQKVTKMIIDLQNVSYRKNGKTILDGINWQVEAGEHWIILGLNGSGKTTLLNLINGYIFPAFGGSANVLGYQFGNCPIADLRKHIGWISNSLSQNIPVNETPLDIILSGKFASIGLWDEVREEDIAKAEGVMEKLGIAKLRERTYGSLSQGEKQKVIIGRALISDPEIIIFDEACNGLDIFAKKDLYGIIEKLAQEQKSIFFVTHNTDEILPIFNKALLIKEGKIHSKGDLKEVIQQENLQDFYGSDVDVFERDDRFFLFAR